MVSESKQTAIGFFPPQDKSWMGGVNYYCNLFQALSKYSDNRFVVFAFVGKKKPKDIIALYEQCGVTVIKTSIFDRFSFSWFIDRVFWTVFGKRIILNNLLKKHSIALISHLQSDMAVDCRQIGWLPDFQHLHLPGMFSERELVDRDKSFRSVASTADAVILSSYDALNDFSKFFPKYAHKGRVAQFVSQPPLFYSELSVTDRDALSNKYVIDRPYIYVPNQFWRHKNHQLLLDAVLLSKKQGANPLVLCSGLMEDYRDNSYVDSLVKYVSDNGLDANVKFLGLIPYKDVFALIKFSLFVLNPSKFEGWSSTVEECKSVGKMMLLSDLAVHKEQYPDAEFFSVDSPESLSEQIVKLTSETYQLPVVDFPSLEVRTQNYSKVYVDVYSQVLSIDKA